MKNLKTEDGEVLDVKRLMGGIDYVLEISNARDHGAKIFSNLQVYWWIVLLSFLLALVLSLFCTILINLAAKSVLWSSIVLCLAILVAVTVSSFIRFAKLRTEREDIFLPSIITTMSSYWFNLNSWIVFGIILGIFTILFFLFLCICFKKIKLAIQIVQESSKAFSSTKSVFVIPIIQSVVTFLLICTFV